MTEFLQQLINGLSLGAIYALIALGYTMVYGVLRFINFAHGDVFMLGAFAGYFLAPTIRRLLPEPAWLTLGAVLLASMLICGLFGILVERLAYRPLRHRPKLTVLITAIGVSLFIEYTGQRVFGADPKSFPELIPDRPLASAAGLSVNTTQVLVLCMTLLLLGGLQWIVLKTRMGTAMRALSFNMIAAQLVGIRLDTIISFTFGLGSALAGAGGILYAMSYPSIDPLMGILPGLKAFVAAVLGGIGSIPGAAIGGLILGVTETLVSGYLSSTYRDAIAFVVLILILLVKPAGLLGKASVEKV